MPSLEGEPLLADCYSSMLGQIYSDMTALLIAATEVCEIFRQQFTAAQCSTISISIQVPVSRLGLTLHYSTIVLVELLQTSWCKVEEHNDKISFLFLFSGQ